MMSNSDQEFDWQNAMPYWTVNGQYEYWVVEERRVGDTGNATYGSLSLRTRKEATAVCNALNSAARRACRLGYARGYAKAQNEVKQYSNSRDVMWSKEITDPQ